MIQYSTLRNHKVHVNCNEMKINVQVLFFLVAGWGLTDTEHVHSHTHTHTRSHTHTCTLENDTITYTQY